MFFHLGKVIDAFFSKKIFWLVIVSTLNKKPYAFPPKLPQLKYF